jgi:hypothetical protein
VFHLNTNNDDNFLKNRCFVGVYGLLKDNTIELIVSGLVSFDNDKGEHCVVLCGKGATKRLVENRDRR